MKRTRTDRRLDYIRKTYGDRVWGTLRLLLAEHEDRALRAFAGEHPSTWTIDIGPLDFPRKNRYLPWVAKLFAEEIRLFDEREDRYSDSIDPVHAPQIDRIFFGMRVFAAASAFGGEREMTDRLVQPTFTPIERTRRWALQQRMQRMVAVLIRNDYVFDWLQAEPQAELMKLSFDVALYEADLWHERLREAARAKALSAASQAPAVHRWPDGWTLQKLGSEHLADEGRIMGHCVGDASYRSSVGSGQSTIYSLRDPKGEPHVTVEAAGGRTISQAWGKGNQRPREDYSARLREALIPLFPDTDTRRRQPWLLSDDELRPMVFANDRYATDELTLRDGELAAIIKKWSAVLGPVDFVHQDSSVATVTIHRDCTPVYGPDPDRRAVVVGHTLVLRVSFLFFPLDGDWLLKALASTAYARTPREHRPKTRRLLGAGGHRAKEAPWRARAFRVLLAEGLVSDFRGRRMDVHLPPFQQFETIELDVDCKDNADLQRSLPAISDALQRARDLARSRPKEVLAGARTALWADLLEVLSYEGVRLTDETEPPLLILG